VAGPDEPRRSQAAEGPRNGPPASGGSSRKAAERPRSEPPASGGSSRKAAERPRSEPQASGGSSGRADPSPFELAGAGRAAALCLHGLTGTPYEVRPIGAALAAAGIAAFGPALPGHNETPERLAAVSHEAWLGAARSALASLRAAHARVFLVGLSMGGLVSLALAAEQRVDAVVVVGVPLRIRALAVRLVPVAKHFVRFLPKGGGSDIRDPAARARHPSYDRMPLAAVHELLRLQRRVRAALPRVEAPLLVAHGAHDRTAHPDDAREILARVASPEREHLVLEASGHVASVDHDGPRLAAAAAAFLGRHAGG
jgi:carboxylesterase